jgi:hypothetical protein
MIKIDITREKTIRVYMRNHFEEWHSGKAVFIILLSDGYHLCTETEIDRQSWDEVSTTRPEGI